MVRFGIRSRLYCGFGSLILLTAGLGGFAQYQLGAQIDQSEARGRKQEVDLFLRDIQAA